MDQIKIYDVAGSAGVSLATVSRVLNHPEKVKPATREKVLKIIKDKGYKPNANARGLASRKSTTVAIVVPTLKRASISEMIQGVEDSAKKYGYMRDNVLHLTIAGLPKSGEKCKFKIFYNGKEIERFYKKITNFKLGIIFKNCKLGKKYIVNNKYFELNDNFEPVNIKNQDEETSKFLYDNGIKTGGGVALFECSYTLSMTNIDMYIVKQHHDFLESYIKGLYRNYGIDIKDYISNKSMINEVA